MLAAANLSTECKVTCNIMLKPVIVVLNQPTHVPPNFCLVSRQCANQDLLHLLAHELQSSVLLHQYRIIWFECMQTKSSPMQGDLKPADSVADLQPLHTPFILQASKSLLINRRNLPSRKASPLQIQNLIIVP